MELTNLCFLGTSVISGAGTAVVIETGSNTYLGSLAKTIVAHKTITSFEKGVNDVSFLLLRFMLVMAPLVFLINGFIKGNWTEAFFFALTLWLHGYLHKWGSFSLEGEGWDEGEYN